MERSSEDECIECIGGEALDCRTRRDRLQRAGHALPLGVG